MDAKEQLNSNNEIQFDPAIQTINKKLMRLSVDDRINAKRSSLLFDDSAPVPSKTEIFFKEAQDETTVGRIKIKKLLNSETRFPRIEEMSHFHYNAIEFPGKLEITAPDDQVTDGNADGIESFLICVQCGEKNWVIRRTYQDLIGLDRQLHRCIYDRTYSNLELLNTAQQNNTTEKQDLDEDMKEHITSYLERLNEIAGNNLNCGPILNWLELDNHGNHLVVMEADDHAINVPAVAAAHVIKRYVAQAPDEITLEVGDFVSVIDMPPNEETIWWRGKKGFEVGFFPSSCVDVLIDKDLDSKLIQHGMKQRPVNKRRGKFISFLRYFFRSRPSKDELMQTGILRERTFGCDLGEHLESTGREIPLVLEMCSAVIEEHGIVDGVYRLSGITSNMQRLRLAFDNEEPPNLTEIRYIHDIHCISSLLKTYFRELPNPLLTYELYDKFLAALRKTDDTERTVAFHHAIQRLPPPHYRTLEYLLRHLEKVASFSGTTSMNEKNLAIVWAPNLLKPNVKEPCGAALLDIRNQAIIIEYLLKNVGIFFDKNLASAAIAFYPEADDVESPLTPKENGDGKVFVLDKSSVDKINGSSPPKLISLTEARARMKESNKIIETSAKLSGGEKFRRKSRPPSNPTIPASIPVSPGPSLLSLEEAQARSKVKNSKMLLRRGSLDILNYPTRSNKDTLSELTPKKRSWKGLFSRNKSISDELDSYGENSKKSQTLSSFKRHASYDMGETSCRSQSSYNIRELAAGDVIERPAHGRKGRKKKLEISSPIGVRTSSFVSYVGGMEKLERTQTAPALELKETAKKMRNRSLDKSKSEDTNLHSVHQKLESTDSKESCGDYRSRLNTIDDVIAEETKSLSSNDPDKQCESDNNTATSSNELSSPVDKKGIRDSIWIQKYDDIARTCLENMNVTDKENSPTKESSVAKENSVAKDNSPTKESTMKISEKEISDDILTMSSRHKSPENIRTSLLQRGSRELGSSLHMRCDAKQKFEGRAMSAEPLKNQADLQRRISSISDGGLPRSDAVNGGPLDWVPVMQRSLSYGSEKVPNSPGKFPVKLQNGGCDETTPNNKDAVTRKESVTRPFSSYDNHPTPQLDDYDIHSDRNTKHRPSIYDNLL
eukprot:gene11263-12443_t